MLSSELLNVLLTLAFVHVHSDAATITITASVNPTYNGTNVALTCSLSGGNSANDNYMFKMVTVGIAGVNYVQCRPSNSTSVKGGLFTAGVVRCDLQSMNVSFIARESFAVNYQCQLVAINGGLSLSSSNILALKVYGKAPSPPEISPPLLTFNDSDPMLINCTSLNGDPPAEMELKITRNALIIANYTATASNKVFLSLNASKALHDATAICQVTNHLLPNMTATSNIKVNHLALRPGVNASQNAFESDVLNCSKLVDSFPPSVFIWSNLSAPAATTQASSESFGPLGYSGNLSCTATNNVIQKSVVVAFYIEKDRTTTLPATSSSRAWTQANASSEVAKTSTSTPPSSSWTPAKTTDATTIITITQRSSSTQGSNLLTPVTGSVVNSTESLQNNEPIIIGVTVSVSLFAAAVVVAVIILRYYRKRTPSRNLPPSQSASKIIGENQLSESQGDDAEDFVCMTDNDLYGSSPPFCAEYKSSVIYDEPNHRPSVGSTLLSASHNTDSPCLSIRPYARDLITTQGIDDRPAASSQCGALQEHGECSSAFGEVPRSAPRDVYAVPIRSAASVQANEPLGDQPISQQSFTKGKLPHNRSFDNMAYMDVQLDARNAPDHHLHAED